MNHRATAGELAGALLWSVQPVAVAVAMPTVAPLLQATLAATVSLFLVWLWTRARHIAVFARDVTLAPGAQLGGLFSLRMAALLLAVTRLGPTVAVEASVAAWWLVAALSRRRRGPLAAAALAALALLVLAPRLDPWGAALAALGALAWAAQEGLTGDPRMQSCGGEKFVIYQLIGACVSLPVVSVVLGENWLVEPSATAWWALLAQLASVVLSLALLWMHEGPAQRASRLPALLAVTPPATLALQLASGQPVPGPCWIAAALLLAAARWPQSPRIRVSE